MKVLRDENVRREDLYEEVWAAPMRDVAARHGISDVMMARVCKRLRIPHPGRGYWVKLEVGKAPSRTALPEAKPGEPIEWRRDGGQPALAQLPRPSALDPSVPLEKKKRVSTKGRHHLVADVEKDFLNTRDSEAGYLRPYKHSLPDVTVSKERLAEGLDVASHVYRTFEAHGFIVEVGNRAYRRPSLRIDTKPEERDRHVHASSSSQQPTIAFVGSVAVGIFVYESSEEVPTEYDYKTRTHTRIDTTTPAFRRKQLQGHYISQQAMPSGRFGVWLYSPYRGVDWSKNFLEKARGQLDGKLATSIVRAAALEAPSIAERYKVEHSRQEEETRRYQREYDEYVAEEAARKAKELAAAREKAEREARARRVALECQSREELVGIMDDWVSRAKVATFIESLEVSLETLDGGRRTALQERLALAKELFAERDPIPRLLAWRTPDEREQQRE